MFVSVILFVVTGLLPRAARLSGANGEWDYPGQHQERRLLLAAKLDPFIYIPLFD
jgi:hypothetical protein